MKFPNLGKERLVIINNVPYICMGCGKKGIANTKSRKLCFLCKKEKQKLRNKKWRELHSLL